MTTIAAPILHDARINARVPTRVAADAAQVSTSTIERLETTGEADHLTLRQLTRLAAAVGLTLHDLTCTHTPQPASEQTDQQLVADLGSLLHRAQRPISIDVLAEATDTDPEDITAALDTLETTLAAGGVGLARTGNTVQLTSRPTTIDNTDIVEAERRHGARARLTLGDAHILYAALNGATEKHLRANANSHNRTGKLINAGLLHRPEKQDQPMIIDDDVLFALNPGEPQ
jgi:DNA-binding Xre family transcriptional regulator